MPPSLQDLLGRLPKPPNLFETLGLPGPGALTTPQQPPIQSPLVTIQQDLTPRPLITEPMGPQAGAHTTPEVPPYMVGQGAIDADAGWGGPEAGALKTVPPGEAWGMDIPTQLPDPGDTQFWDAVKNTEGVQAAREGLYLYLTRFQKDTLPGADAIRGGVFYSPGWSTTEYQTHNSGSDTSLGGSQRVDGPTLFKNPYVIGRGPKSDQRSRVGEALDELTGTDGEPHRATDELSEALDAYGGVTGMVRRTDAQRVGALAKFYTENGMSPEDANQAATEIVTRFKDNSGEMKYVATERIVTELARLQGHDGILLLSGPHRGVGNKTTIDEVIDIREAKNPGPTEYHLGKDYDTLRLPELTSMKPEGDGVTLTFAGPASQAQVQDYADRIAREPMGPAGAPTGIRALSQDGMSWAIDYGPGPAEPDPVPQAPATVTPAMPPQPTIGPWPPPTAGTGAAYDYAAVDLDNYPDVADAFVNLSVQSQEDLGMTTADLSKFVDDYKAKLATDPNLVTPDTFKEAVTLQPLSVIKHTADALAKLDPASLTADDKAMLTDTFGAPLMNYLGAGEGKGPGVPQTVQLMKYYKKLAVQDAADKQIAAATAAPPAGTAGGGSMAFLGEAQQQLNAYGPTEGMKGHIALQKQLFPQFEKTLTAMLDEAVANQKKAEDLGLSYSEWFQAYGPEDLADFEADVDDIDPDDIPDLNEAPVGAGPGGDDEPWVDALLDFEELIDLEGGLTDDVMAKADVLQKLYGAQYPQLSTEIAGILNMAAKKYYGGAGPNTLTP